jgi:hypothetical protein
MSVKGLTNATAAIGRAFAREAPTGAKEVHDAAFDLMTKRT